MVAPGGAVAAAGGESPRLESTGAGGHSAICLIAFGLVCCFVAASSKPPGLSSLLVQQLKKVTFRLKEDFDFCF